MPERIEPDSRWLMATKRYAAVTEARGELVTIRYLAGEGDPRARVLVDEGATMTLDAFRRCAEPVEGVPL